MRSLRLLTASSLALGSALTAGADAAPRESSHGPARIVEGAKTVGQGVEATAKNIGATVTAGATEAGHRAKPVLDTLHDRAKGFGEAIFDGMKYAGRTIAGFFGAVK